MKKLEITAKASLIAQVQQNAKVTVIVDNDIMYLPVMSVPGIGSDSDNAEEEAKVVSISPATKAKPAKKKAGTPVAAATQEEVEEVEEAPFSAEVPTYTEKELMEMSAGDLTDLLHDHGIDASEEVKGRKTNKALRTVVLAAQKASTPKAAPVAKKGKAKAEAAPVAPAGTSAKDIAVKTLTSLDAGNVETEEATEILVKAYGNGSEEAVEKAIDAFFDDADMTVESVIEAIEAALPDNEAEAEDAPAEVAKPTRGKKKKGAPKNTELTEKDLKIGGTYEFYWEESTDDDGELIESGWYKGDVTDIDEDGTWIAYEGEDEEEAFDSEIISKIKKA